MAAFIRALQKEGIPVKAHVGYFGEARLRPDPQMMDKLQRTLRNVDIPIKGGELAALLTRQEIGGIIQNINRARSENAKQKLTERLQGLLDRRTAEGVANEVSTQVTGRSATGNDIGNVRPIEGVSSEPDTPAQPERAGNAEAAPRMIRNRFFSIRKKKHKK